MLPAKERLRRSGLFRRIYMTKKTISTPFFVLYVLPRQGRSAGKLPLTGFVAGKKVHNKAVMRNRARRRVREAYRQLRRTPEAAAELHLEQWYTLLFVLSEGAVGAKWQDICQHISGSLRKANEKFGNRPVQELRQ